MKHDYLGKLDCYSKYSKTIQKQNFHEHLKDYTGQIRQKKENFFGIFLGAILGLGYHVVNEFLRNSKLKVVGTSIQNDHFFEVSRPATWMTWSKLDRWSILIQPKNFFVQFFFDFNFFSLFRFFWNLLHHYLLDTSTTLPHIQKTLFAIFNWTNLFFGGVERAV